MGIPFLEAERILEFEDAREYIEEVIKDNQRQHLTRMLEIADACRMAYHAKDDIYQAWSHKIRRRIDALDEEPSTDEQTIFDRLRKHVDKRETLFDIMKRRGKRK